MSLGNAAWVFSPFHSIKQSWRIGTNKETADTAQEADIVKFIKSLRLRWYTHTEKMNEERMPKNRESQNVRNEEKRKTMENMDL
jgi:hypothetical protein